MIHREDRPSGATALDGIARNLERGLAILLAVLAVVIPSAAILIMVTMGAATRAQGGRFYVAIIALVLLGLVDSQFGRLLRRRAPGLMTSSAERWYALSSLLLMLIMAVVLIGLAWRLP